MKAIITASLLAALTIPFAGCDATTARAPGNTTLGGAALGGLTGAGIGAASNGSKGALVGGLIGTAGGALVGNQMEKNRDAAAAQQGYYGAPQPAYGAPAAPAPSYGAPSGAPAGYGAPAPGFGAPPPTSY